MINNTNFVGEHSQFSPSLDTLKTHYSDTINKMYGEGLFSDLADSGFIASELWSGTSENDIRKTLYSALGKNKPEVIKVNTKKVSHTSVDKTKASSIGNASGKTTSAVHNETHDTLQNNSFNNFFNSSKLRSFDTETTGLDADNPVFSKRSRIWQVGLATDGTSGVEKHTSPFFTSRADGSLQLSPKMSDSYLTSSLKHSNGKFSQLAFSNGNFNTFMEEYKSNTLSSLDSAIKSTLGTIESGDVVVLQNMNFENRILRSSLEQGILSPDLYQDIASRMSTVDLNADGSVNTLFQRPATVQENMRKADFIYHTEYLRNFSEDSFQTYRNTVNKAISEYSSAINDKQRVGAVAVELQDLSKAFLANAANAGYIDKNTATLGLNVDFLSRAILGKSEAHTALQDSDDTLALFKHMWEMNSELNSGAELSENTKKHLNNIRQQQPDEIKSKYISSVRSVLNDFKDRGYTKIGDNLSWYNPAVSLREQTTEGYKDVKLKEIATTRKRTEYSLKAALVKLDRKYDYLPDSSDFNRKAYTNSLIESFNSGDDFKKLYERVDNDYFGLSSEKSGVKTSSNIPKAVEASSENATNHWDETTELLGKTMKKKTKATILGGLGVGLATMAFTPSAGNYPPSDQNVSEQFYNEQYLGTAFVDFNERNKHYMM